MHNCICHFLFNVLYETWILKVIFVFLHQKTKHVKYEHWLVSVDFVFLAYLCYQFLPDAHSVCMVLCMYFSYKELISSDRISCCNLIIHHSFFSVSLNHCMLQWFLSILSATWWSHFFFPPWHCAYIPIQLKYSWYTLVMLPWSHESSKVNRVHLL